MSWTDALRRTRAFLARFPLHQQPPFTTFTQPEIDSFAMANGYYIDIDWTVPADVDRARNVFIGQLRDTGITSRWRSSEGMEAGFGIKVISRRPTVWEVQPLHVNASHEISQLPRRNLVTLNNRAVAATRKVAGVDQRQITKAERKNLRNKTNALQDATILANNMAAAITQQVDKADRRLRHDEPASPLLPPPGRP